MSPTVFRHKEYRFQFYSKEEPRMHIHVFSPIGEAKFWLEPTIELAETYGLTARQLIVVRTVIMEYRNEIAKAWEKHFGC